ncbi:ankyrin repeat and SOCS box protein 16 isoform X1 [Carcharodon carcharias]|uniref:ankyrin repeat and SOCS box protein 16 isoform X1 n=1 Tax=Carcharodon carcharias TaxID=13397 RepID=UPI001B7E5FBD|nr:ankyrin repeat and SOCS box protein 16 isoform X1 [Carcharodon carcharias]
MFRDTFPFTASTLRSLRLQRELQGLEDERRALYRFPRNRLTTAVSQTAFRESRTGPQISNDPAVHDALCNGDLDKIRSIFKSKDSVNVIIETSSHELSWSAELGLWSLISKQKQTSALHITAARGHTACVKHLLGYGADVNAAPGGATALHTACASGHAECAQLLLSIGANPNAISEEGYTPLHLCTSPQTFLCAKLLLEHGARVNMQTKDRENTPLHVAAKHGLDEHVDLYLSYCAYSHKKNREGETALNAACSYVEKPEAFGRYYRVCEMLINCGADVKTAGKKNHTPLHNACGNGHPGIVDLLLLHSASVNAKNCAGYTPMDCILQAVEDHLEHHPEQIVIALLNHGAAPVDPKILKQCAMSPWTMEALLNTYESVPLCNSWIEAVPLDVWRKHQIFYESIIQMTDKPRSLQHLARCTLRNYLGTRCHSVIPQLQLPNSFTEFLLLKFESYIK